MKHTRTRLSVAAFLVLFISACSQPQDVASPELEPQFGTPLPDKASRVAADLKRDTVYVAGTDSADGEDQGGPGGIVFLRRYSQAGELVWEKRLPESEGRDNPEVDGLQVDAAGHVYLAWSDYNNDSFVYQGARVLKLDTSGEVLYQLDFGDSDGSRSVDGIYDFDVDPAGNAYLVGSGPVEVEDAGLETRNFVRKYDAQGQLVWESLRDVVSVDLAIPHELGLAGDGSVYVYGYEGGRPADNLDGKVGVLTKYSNAGDTLWQRTLVPEERIVGQTGDDVVVAAGAEDAYVVINRYPELDSRSDRRIIVQRYHADSSLYWQRTIIPADRATASNLDTDDRGNVYLAGGTSGGLFVRKYTAVGQLKWTFSPKLENTSQLALDVSANDGRTLYTAGETTGSVNGEYFGSGDAFLLRLNARGEKVWSR